MRVLSLSVVLLATLAGTAAAKPVRPGNGALLPGTPPPALQIVRGEVAATVHLQPRAGAIVACSQRGRATFLRLRATLRWDQRGRVLRANVSGGSAAFNRCAARALGGTIAAANGRRGSAWVSFIVRKPDVVAVPTPVPSVSALQTCTRDDDCTLHFRTHACVAGDPVAVNKLDPAGVRAAFPVRRIECAMGGPQYEELRMSNERRWSTTCEQSRCVVHDHSA